jgi:hypothetical protein
MPKRRPKVYRLKLALDLTKRRELDALCRQLKFALVLAVEKGFRSIDKGMSIHPSMVGADIANNISTYDLDGFHAVTIKGLVEKTTEAYAEAISGMTKSRMTKKILCELPGDEVIFSTEGKNVRLPYLGLVAYKGNNKVFSDNIIRPDLLPRRSFGTLNCFSVHSRS